MKRPTTGGNRYVAGAGSPGTKVREVTFAEARRLGLPEVEVDKKEWFVEVKKKTQPEKK